MKLLFDNTTEVTKEEIIKFNYFNLINNKFLMVILLYMPVIWLVSGVGMFIKQSDFRRLIVSILLSIAWLLLIFLPPYITGRRGYKTENYSNEYEFYEDKFIAKNKFTREDIFYVSVYRAYETRKYFYIYVNKKSALIVKKDNFKDSNAFSEFLSSKLNKRYKKRMF